MSTKQILDFPRNTHGMADWYVFELRNSTVHENDRTGSVKKKTTNNKSKKPHTTFKVVQNLV